MVAPPVPRQVEPAAPDSTPSLPSGVFLALVVICGNGKAFADHDLGEIAPPDGASGQQAAILVMSFGAAIHPTFSQQRCHPVASGKATGPISALFITAGLLQFGGIDPQEPHPFVAQAEAVAIAGSGPALQRFGSRLEIRRHYGRSRQNNYCQQGSGAPGEQALSM